MEQPVEEAQAEMAQGQEASVSKQSGEGGQAELQAGGSGGPALPPDVARAGSSEQGLQQQLRDREAQIQRLSTQLQHYRSWVASVNARVLHMNPKAVQNAKRLYVGNLPANITEEELRSFLNQLMQQTGGQVGPEPAVVQCHITQERNFAFAEFRSVEEASNAMGLDGVMLHDCSLKIRRPSNYDLATSLMLGPITPDPTMDTSCLNLSKPVQEESPNKLFIGGLPCEWPESAVRTLLQPYGPLKAFNLVMDKATGNSKGYAFCEFEDPDVTDKAIAGLNGQRAGTKTLTVKRAAEGARQAASAGLAAPTAGASSMLSSVPAEEAARGFSQAFATRKGAGPSTTTTTTYIMTPPPPTMVMSTMQPVPGSARSHGSQSAYVGPAPGRSMPGESTITHIAPLPQHVVQPYMVQPYPGPAQPHSMHFTGPAAPPPMGSIMLAPGPPPGATAFPTAEHGTRPAGRGLQHVAPGVGGGRPSGGHAGPSAGWAPSPGMGK